jgi:hypothetical protein
MIYTRRPAIGCWERRGSGRPRLKTLPKAVGRSALLSVQT